MTEIVCHLSGTDVASAGAVTVKTNRSPVGTLARQLIADGVDPGATFIVKRGETVCFKPMIIGDWAKHSTSETDNVSVRHAEWRPMPDGLHGLSHPSLGEGAA